MPCGRRWIRNILLAALPIIASPNHAHAQAPASVPQTAEIFVVNHSDSIMAYAPGANGNVVPDWVMGFQLSPYGIARDPAGRIYVTNNWNNSISVFAPGHVGAASPVAIIRGSKAGLDRPTGIAVDSKGKIYVVNGGSVFDLSGPRPGRIDVYAAGSDGNIAPVAVLMGNRTRLENPNAVALDSSGKIYVTDSGDGEIESKSPPRVMVYSAGSKGNVAPITTISGERTDLWFPYGIALDASGKIYVTNNASQGPRFGAPDDDYENRVTVYPPRAKGNIAPIARIAGRETGIGQPGGIAVDSGGRVYVTNECVRRFEGDPHKSLRDQLRCWQSVTVYPAGADGDAAPIAMIFGAQTGMRGGPKGVMVDPKGEIYLTWCLGRQPGIVTVYPANRSGDVKPIATITDGADTELHGPVSIAFDSSGQIYALNGSDGVNVYPSGTNHNVPPLFTIAGDKTQLQNVSHSSIALDSQKNIYVTNRVYSGGTNFNGTVSVFAHGSNGDVKASATINFDKGRWPMAVRTDSSGNTYVLLSSPASDKQSIVVYPPGSGDNIAPIATIRGINLVNSVPNVVSLDSVGRIYVLNSGATPSEKASVEVYPTLAKLRSDPDYPNVKPVAKIVGAKTKLAHPQAIALDSMDRIYVLNCSQASDSHSITVYPPLGNRTGKFDETPLVNIAGPDTKLDMSPVGIAVWNPPAR